MFKCPFDRELQCIDCENFKFFTKTHLTKTAFRSIIAVRQSTSAQHADAQHEKSGVLTPSDGSNSRLRCANARTLNLIRIIPA